jgi:hypothetical protein
MSEQKNGTVFEMHLTEVEMGDFEKKYKLTVLPLLPGVSLSSDKNEKNGIFVVKISVANNPSAVELMKRDIFSHNGLFTRQGWTLVKIES